MRKNAEKIDVNFRRTGTLSGRGALRDWRCEGLVATEPAMKVEILRQHEIITLISCL